MAARFLQLMLKQRKATLLADLIFRGYHTTQTGTNIADRQFCNTVGLGTIGLNITHMFSRNEIMQQWFRVNHPRSKPAAIRNFKKLNCTFIV